MANTTFKGPVRSQNGFQELVDGVWTPVGGGGGGVTYIPYTPGTTNYTVTGLTTPGDSASFVWQLHEPQLGDEVVITADAIPGTTGGIFVVTSVFPGDPVSGSVLLNSGQVFSDIMASAVATVIYVGNFTSMGSPYAIFSVSVTGFSGY